MRFPIGAPHLGRGLGAGAALLAALACGGSPPSSPAGQPPPTGRVRPALPAVPAEWAAWVQANQFPIRSTSAADTNFDDLQFLKGVLGERRLVQLGESGHGVAEFDSVKVRLIQFLHQQMGFDVIAFESGLWECHRADELAGDLSAESLMRQCIFGVWHTEETLPLFEYIKSTRVAGRPLTLAGFDTQFSSSSMNARPAELRALLEAVDPALAESAYALDSELVRLVLLGRDDARAQISGKVAEMTAGYEEIADVIDRQQARLERAFPSRPLLPRVMGQAMRMAPSLVRSLAGSTTQYGAIRDAGMADNVTFLLEQLYPGRKILVWAHNYHVQHDTTELPAGSVSMGHHVSRRHRDDLYTIGLFMYWGQAAWNDRRIYTVSAPAPNGLEALLGRASAPAAFVDVLGQGRSPGTEWMYQPIATKSWGFYDEVLTLRRQYDGILFVDEVHPPRYR
jgi:erythromycin esterase